MNTLIVSYDLKNKDHEYEKLYETIKKADGWWHYLDSFWIIKSNDDVGAWTDRLISQIESDDRLIVIDITGNRTNGWLPFDAWNWIRKNTDLNKGKAESVIDK